MHLLKQKFSRYNKTPEETKRSPPNHQNLVYHIVNSSVRHAVPFCQGNEIPVPRSPPPPPFSEVQTLASLERWVFPTVPSRLATTSLTKVMVGDTCRGRRRASTIHATRQVTALAATCAASTAAADGRAFVGIQVGEGRHPVMRILQHNAAIILN